jgi:hypothetical protein
MLDLVERVMPHWSPALPGHGSVLACRCFANEECGNYTIAEHAGRAAVELDPGDLWATHGIAHVLEMQGRRSEGIAWIAAQEGRSVAYCDCDGSTFYAPSGCAGGWWRRPDPLADPGVASTAG